ncbi:efflux RND transporter periplasmic adaptor subunit [Fontivita pretiosa]|uniref:efflux RND transporter periplasmic adaptor subunit n=1 Tax=Fontivita pretiosa TaxID=2989684 RepID=UPI003D1648EF
MTSKTTADLSLLTRSSSQRHTIPRPPYPWKTRLLLPAGIVLSLLAVTAWSARDTLLPATPLRIVPVVARAINSSSAASGAPGTIVTQAAGWVEPDPYPVAASALADGVVREVLVLEGQRVKAGDVVVRLIDDDAKLAVQRAEAELAARRAELLAAERTWDNPIERDRAVATAAALVDQARAELFKLEADIQAEQARVDELADQLRRIEQTSSSGAASQLELVGTQFRLSAQRATLEATKARRPALEALLRQHQAELAAAREHRRLRIEESRALDSARAAMALAEAQLAEAKLRLSRMEIRAPIDGIVMNRLVEPGGKLVLGMDSAMSAHAVRLYDPSRLQVRVDVPLADAAKVGVGMPAQIVADVMPDRVFRGVVSRVVHEADVTKNTLQFKVRIDDPDPQLKPEMLARVRFLSAGTDSTAHATTSSVASGSTVSLFVPESLIRTDGATKFVWLADRGRGVAVKRAITPGTLKQDGWIEVMSGLSAGDAVVAEPVELTDGQRIQIVGEAKTP